MQFGEFRPGDGDHFAAGVELHGAGAERDHRLVQRQVLAFQLAQVAKHLGLAVVGVEHRMLQVGRSALQDRRDAVGHRPAIQVRDIQPVAGAEEDLEQGRQGRRVTGFVRGSGPAAGRRPRAG